MMNENDLGSEKVLRAINHLLYIGDSENYAIRRIAIE